MNELWLVGAFIGGTVFGGALTITLLFMLLTETPLSLEGSTALPEEVDE